MLKKRRLIYVFIFCAWLAVPIAALTLGAKSVSIENRALRPFPHVTLEGLSTGTWFSETSLYLQDRLPFREYAIAAYSRLHLNLFGETGNEKVSLGKDGWLFLNDSIRQPCENPKEIEARMVRLAQIAAGLKKRGVRMVWAISPDKEAIYPEKLSDKQKEEASCALKNREVMRRVIKQKGIAPYFVDLWTALEKGKIAHADHALYRQYDTHWNYRGAWQAARAIVNTLQKHVWLEGNIANVRTINRDGDLGRMLGLSMKEEEEVFRTLRPGVQAIKPAMPFCVPALMQRSESWVELADEAHISRMIDGHTIILHDSFFIAIEPLIAPYITQRDDVHFQEIRTTKLYKASHCANTIILQTVERHFFDRAADVIRAFQKQPEVQSQSLFSFQRTFL